MHRIWNRPHLISSNHSLNVSSNLIEFPGNHETMLRLVHNGWKRTGMRMRDCSFIFTAKQYESKSRSEYSLWWLIKSHLASIWPDVKLDLSRIVSDWTEYQKTGKIFSMFNLISLGLNLTSCKTFPSFASLMKSVPPLPKIKWKNRF